MSGQVDWSGEIDEDRDGDPLEKKRQEIVLRMSRRGYRAEIALELTQVGLAELERRLNKLELHEEKDGTKTVLDYQGSGVRILRPLFCPFYPL